MAPTGLPPIRCWKVWCSGRGVAEDVKGTISAGAAQGSAACTQAFALPAPPHVLRAAMNRHVGLERNAEGLGEALAAIARLEQTGGGEPALLNMLAAARLVTAGALAREESRGGHWRSDFPLTRKGRRAHLHDFGRSARIEGVPQRRARP